MTDVGTKIKDLTAKTTTADTDEFVINDVAGSNADKKITRADLVGSADLTMEAGNDIILSATGVLHLSADKDTSISERVSTIISCIAGGTISSLGASGGTEQGMFEVNRATGNLDALNDAQINFSFRRLLDTPATGTISLFDWFDLNDASPSAQHKFGGIKVESTDIGDGAEDGNMKFQVSSGGNTTEPINIRGGSGDILFSKVLRASGADFDLGNGNNIRCGTSTGVKISETTTGKIGFWGVLPVIQFATTGETTGHSAVGGTNVDASDTFTGNTGDRAYTINDIVKALKLCGIMDTTV